MDLGFRGDVADYYHRYRRGYPDAVIDCIVETFALTDDDIVVDLGCGTGQLSMPIAPRVRAVIGIDPEPDMLQRARRAGLQRGVRNISWLIGADVDIPAVASMLGERSLGALTIGQALHWMDHDTLFRRVARLIRPGGGIAVIANGTPIWQLDTDWSRDLREFLRVWSGHESTATCGTDETSRLRYRESLAAAGFRTSESTHEYSAELSLEQIVGGVFSAFGVDQLPPPDERGAFADSVRQALGPSATFLEPVRISMQLGTLP